MSWKPTTPNHAIERVAFTLLLKEMPNNKPMSAIQAAIRQKASEIGVNEMTYLQSPFFQISPIDAAGVLQQPLAQFTAPPQGQSFRKTVNGKVEEEIICNGTTLVFSATEYLRWRPFLERVEKCFSDAVEYIKTINDISEIRVEYWDRFDLPDTSNELILTENLINPHSRILSPFYATQQGPFHAHTGFFCADEDDKKILVNANVEIIANIAGMPPVLAANLKAQAKIYTLASTKFSTPDGCFSDWASIKETATKRHNLLKSILGDIIHPNLAAQITLAAEVFSQ